MGQWTVRRRLLSGLVVAFSLHEYAHAHTINPCYCDEACYTNEVSNLTCTDREVRFNASGLPDENHELMLGISGSNQQFPSMHNYRFRVNMQPKLAAKVTKTKPGAIGVAVNGIPLFNPSTQAAPNPLTGKRPHTLDVGELDSCGGHAGRGDDYHYHIAPKCLINELGKQHIEVQKKPIGFAMDGFPILALGWFEQGNDVETQLDECRGMRDAEGKYFYNVMHESKWDILNCFSGEPRGLAKDSWRQRKDKNGRDIVGAPIGFRIKDYTSTQYGTEVCHVMHGVLQKEQLLIRTGTVKAIRNKTGSLFHCNNSCYGLFFELEKQPQFRGRVMIYDLITKACPADFNLNQVKPFTAYRGPAVLYRGAKPPK